jgi:hypothetical protein
MSNVSNRHVFTAYVSAGSGKSVALSGQRLSVVRFKAGKDGRKAMASQCASVPVATLTSEDCEFLSTHINGWFASVQDEIVREVVVSGADSVTTEQLSVEAVRNYLTTQAAGDRLNGEQIGYWFDTELADVLTVAFADKLGIGDVPSEAETTKLAQMCRVYRDCFTAMAGGRTSFDTAKREKLLKALALADTTDGIGQRLQAKLEAMSKVTVEEMLGL